MNRVKKFPNLAALLVAAGVMIPQLSSGAPFLTLLTKPAPLITQLVIGAKACGPTALLYAFKLGNDEMREAYDKLPGSEDGEKLKNLVKLFGDKPSAVHFHTVRLDALDGMAPPDLYATANDLMTLAMGRVPHLDNRGKLLSLQSQILNRQQAETEAGSFARRVHDTLKRSLLNNVPVVSIIIPYVGPNGASREAARWREHNGHYVVITGVSDMDEHTLGFKFQYLDPETGQANEAYLQEEVRLGFWAREDFPDGSGRWINTSVKARGGGVSSPYLTVTAPGLNLVPNKMSQSQRVVLTLMNVVGNFTQARAQDPPAEASPVKHSL